MATNYLFPGLVWPDNILGSPRWMSAPAMSTCINYFHSRLTQQTNSIAIVWCLSGSQVTTHILIMLRVCRIPWSDLSNDDMLYHGNMILCVKKMIIFSTTKECCVIYIESHGNHRDCHYTHPQYLGIFTCTCVVTRSRNHYAKVAINKIIRILYYKDAISVKSSVLIGDTNSACVVNP